MKNYEYFEKVKRISKEYEIEELKVEELIELVYQCIDAEGISKETGIPLYKVKKILLTEYVKCNRVLNKYKVKNLIHKSDYNIEWLRFVNSNLFSNPYDVKKFNSIKSYYLNNRYISEFLYVPNEWLTSYEYNVLSNSPEDFYEKE